MPICFELAPDNAPGRIVAQAHGGRTVEVLCTRIALRLLALAAGVLHNYDMGDPGRHFAAYGH